MLTLLPQQNLVHVCNTSTLLVYNIGKKYSTLLVYNIGKKYNYLFLFSPGRILSNISDN